MADAKEISKAILQIRIGGKIREKGLNSLITQIGGSLKRYFLKHRILESDADELVQNVFIKIVSSIDGFRDENELSSLKWISVIKHHVLIDFVRKSNSSIEKLTIPQTDPDDDQKQDITEQDYLVDSSTMYCFHQQMKRFCEKHPTQAIHLNHIIVDGWDIAELSEFLKKTHTATKQYVYECREKLRGFLNECRG